MSDIVTGPVMYVCPVCGPTSMMYSGRIVPKLCARCRANERDDLAPATTPEQMADWGRDLTGGYAEKLAAKDAAIARLEAEVKKWEASANATHKAASDNAARASKAEADNRRLRLALNAAADALEGEGVFHCDHPNGYCPRCFAARDAAREAAKEEV